MEIVYGVLIAALGLLMVMIIRLVTTFFHEMGHAIPALLFTDKPVEVYIGSYGDISKTLQLHFGRLKMFLKVNIFEWQIGLCRREGKVESIWKKALIIIGGPIASLIISIPLIYKLKEFQSQELIFFFMIVFIGAAIVDLCVNLYPFSSPMKMHDGGIAFSDGYQLRSLMIESIMPEAYFDFQKLFQDKKYDELIEKTESHIELNPKDRFAYDFLIESLVQKKEHNKILEVYSFRKDYLPISDGDFFIIGKTYKQLDKYEEALSYFDKFYYKNYNNPELINEIAETHIAIGNFEKAIESINAIIDESSSKFSLLLNRATALIKIGSFEEAKADLDLAREINQDDGRLFFQYGILFDKLNQKASAIEYLEKAKALGYTIAGLDFIIEEIRRN